jgi:O-acetyl-ADP-ribose deacetylase (regulator of RNase III)
MNKLNIHKTQIELLQGDITDLAVDAIVNAANEHLVLGAGVAGAIRAKGGPSIQEECNKIGGTPVGTAVITGGGRLKAKYVIHAVGPRMGEGDEDQKLADATRNSLRLADENSLKSIALPAISTGIFGFPIQRCAEIMLYNTRSYVEEGTGIERVVFCLYDGAAMGVFERQLQKESAK